MSKDKKQRYLYIDGQAVPVTEEVYRAYWHYTAKEDYFTRQLKTERFLADQDTQTAALMKPAKVALCAVMSISPCLCSVIS